MHYIITRGEDKKQVIAGNRNSNGSMCDEYWSTDIGRAYKFASSEEAKHVILSLKFSDHVAGMKSSDIIYVEEVASRKIDSAEVSELRIIYEREKTKLAALLDKKIQLMEELDKVNLEIGKATGG